MLEQVIERAATRMDPSVATAYLRRLTDACIAYFGRLGRPGGDSADRELAGQTIRHVLALLDLSVDLPDSPLH